MSTIIMHSGEKMKAYAVVAPKLKNINVQFILPCGFILPTFRGKDCDWYVVEADKEGFMLADQRKKLKTYYTMRGTDRCCASGRWGELGVNNDVDLKLGQMPPKEFRDSILVKKSEVCIEV